MTKYLEECLGEKFKFDLEDTKIIEGKNRQFTFVFQSGNQGRKAEQLLKENIKESGEEIDVSILEEDPRVATQMFLSKCEKELREKIKSVMEKHASKINEITARLDQLSVRKHIRLDEYEKVQSERDALKQKKDELEQQQQEFERFSSQVIDILSTQSSQPHSSVENAVKELRKSFGRECHRLDAALPMYAKKTIIVETIKENQVCVVLGETGSGKSTQMTQYLYEAGFAERGLIVCTQPRKVAATSLAAHVAREMGGVPGQIVGCHVGGNIQASKTTGIVYATDHLLLNECLKDPSLSKYSCIIIDEAHERSLYSDLLLGMIKKSLAERPELRVVITSATIDPALFVAYFDHCPVLKVSGRMFPVDVIWRDGPSSTENYLQEAVRTVREIHNKEGQGDILVFLTTPVETERACENLSKMVSVDSLVCLPLHGKLRQEEQRKVFDEETSKRKVVFATNCAETSITIPGIRYVVDTGMVKEMKFEPKRNKSSLEVTTTSKSSAEQRKGRAGRTQSGKCYRLYSEEEYTAMEDGSKPEILRVHLGKAVLKLMELGIEDITHFEFVESPPLESIELALDTLKSLGAIAHGKLTDLGHKIARVPVEPRLAKLIFDGIDQEIGAEAVALAAIATVSGSVFFRMGTEEEKQIADRRKVGFCHNGGDLLTLLEVYRKYLEQSKVKRNKWAFDHSLNAKSLRLTDETVKELKLALKHELNIKVPDAIQRNDDTDLKLQRILISCYATNLCVFTGHEKAGYRVASFNHCVQLHPSSALKFLGATPQFIVFEQLLKTSRDFAINATPVPECWLRDMISEEAVNYDVDNLMSTVLTQVALPCSPDLMTLAFGGLRRRILDQVEEKVSKLCDDSLVVLEKDEKSGQMKVFVASNYTAKAVSVVKDHLEESRKSLRCEDREEQLNQECQGTRIVWGQGGEVQEVLMPHMYRTVTVGDVQDEQLVLDHLKSFGEVVKHKLKEQNGKTRVFATFKKSENASKVVKGSSDVSLDSNLNVQPSHSMPDDVQVSQFMVRAKWCRRPVKGTGSIEFFNSEDFSHALGRLSLLMIKSRQVKFQADKNRQEQIFMWGLNRETSGEDVKSAIEMRIPSVKVKNIFIHRKPAFETTDEELESQRNSLQERLERLVKNVLTRQERLERLERLERRERRDRLIKSNPLLERFELLKRLEHLERLNKNVSSRQERLVNSVPSRPVKNVSSEGQFSVFMVHPDPKNFEGLAHLTFKDAEQGEAAVRGLNGKFISGIGIITLQRNFSTTLLCPRNVFTVIKDELETIIKELEQAFGKMLVVKVTDQQKYKRVAIVIRSDCTEHFIHATTVLNKSINGDEIDCKISKILEILLTNPVKEVLQTIQKDTGTVINQDWRNKVVKIHGSQASRESAKLAINKFLDDSITSTSHPWEIQLRGPSRPRGLLKTLFERFGIHLQGLQEIPGVQNIHVEFRSHKLNIISSEEAQETITRYVDKCCESLLPNDSSDLKTENPGTQLTCGICLCDLDETADIYRLACCGHAYDKSCVILQLKSAEFPLKCVAENCGEPVVWRDLQNLLNQSERKKLAVSAIDAYVRANPDIAKYCPTADCGMVYRVSRRGRRHMCGVCLADICTSCHTQYHSGLTCAMFKSEKQVQGHLEEWMVKDPSNRKNCPKCKTPIEKNLGCNHMTCSQCNSHMCWLCLEVFPSGDEALHQELCYSVHLSLPAVLVPLKSFNCTNLAHHINTSINDTHVQQVWVHVPMKSPEDECEKHLFEDEEEVEVSKLDRDPWEWWNLFRTMCANSRKIGLALEISAELPSEEELERWCGEPVKAAILPTSLFLTNKKGYPVLPRAHQAFFRRLFRMNAQLILTGVNKHKDKGLGFYYQYLSHLYQTQPELDNVSQFARGYEDYLQCPLQPLMDNLESQTYEIFERDPIKYRQYQRAVHQALLDRVPEDSKETVVTVIMVVGAGRGPLVRASLTAGEESGRKVRIYAVEKNPNAVVTLETLKEEEWGGDVTVVSCDMREWDAPEQADILVSELLGSFGDNELSPECLDGAQRFLKEDGISIPCEYTSFLAPLSAPKLHFEVSQSNDSGKGPLAPFETPYVVRLHNVTVISPPQPCFIFSHPNRAERIDNSRVKSLEFEAKTSFTLHGFAGYFETILYKDITMSIRPETHSEGMFSWFPFFFPIKEPQYVPAGSTIACHFWRKCTTKKVWYEWCMSRPAPVPLHNLGGRSYVIGL